MDRTRCKREFEAAIVDDLAWLGLAFAARRAARASTATTTPRRSQRFDARALVYPCFCSPRQVAAPAPGAIPTARRSMRERAAASARAKSRARLAAGDAPPGGSTSAAALAAAPAELAWREYGESDQETLQRADPSAWGDFVLRGRDSAASYHLAVVVDDALQRVTDVVRGRDLFAATSVHRLLQALLGLPAPRYRHHRLVLDAKGVKLAKSRTREAAQRAARPGRDGARGARRPRLCAGRAAASPLNSIDLGGDGGGTRTSSSGGAGGAWRLGHELVDAVAFALEGNEHLPSNSRVRASLIAIGSTKLPLMTTS